MATKSLMSEVHTPTGCPKYKPALMCYECRSDRSNEDCIRRGRLTKCQANQGSCENTVRVNHGRLEIIKGCKQTEACNNNMLQNKLSSSSGRTQCNFGAYETVCRCCCTSSKCNNRPLYCAHADLQEIGNSVQGTGKEYTIANLLRSPRRRYLYPNRKRHMRTNPNYFNTQQQQQQQQVQQIQQRRTTRNWWGTRYAAHHAGTTPVLTEARAYEDSVADTLVDVPLDGWILVATHLSHLTDQQEEHTGSVKPKTDGRRYFRQWKNCIHRMCMASIFTIFALKA